MNAPASPRSRSETQRIHTPLRTRNPAPVLRRGGHSTSSTVKSSASRTAGLLILRVELLGGVAKVGLS